MKALSANVDNHSREFIEVHNFMKIFAPERARAIGFVVALALGAVAVAVVVALAIVLTSEPGWAQSSLDSIVSGVEGKGNEVVSAGRRIAVIGLNIVFIAMGIAAMMRKISWGWFGLAVLGAILVNFSGQFSSWLGNFGGGLIPGLPGI